MVKLLYTIMSIQLRGACDLSGLILFRREGKIERIMPSPYKDEDVLKELIKSHPEILSFTALSNRIILLAEEYPVGSMSIDLLCLDDEGRIFIIETKLRRNQERRQIVAQLLDYASQLRKQSFDIFQRKIEEKNGGRAFRDILTDLVDEHYVEETLDKVRTNLREGDFVLVAVMDEMEQQLKELLTYLNEYMDIYGIELKRYDVKDYGEIFIPGIIPQVQKGTFRQRRTPITIEQLKRNYEQKDLEVEINDILKSFKLAESSNQNVRIRLSPCYITLSLFLEDCRIDVSLNKRPEGDHGVWANNPEYYQRVYEIGRGLGLDVKLSDKPFAKIIRFNGVDGIKKVSAVMQDLISELKAL